MKKQCNECRIKINVSGEIYETYAKSLNFFPTTLLGDYKKRRQYYCHKTKQYFFNRHRVSFEAILFFYQSHGILTRPPNIPPKLFEDECVFYEIPKSSIIQMKEKCGDIITEDKITNADNAENNAHNVENNVSYREGVWNFFQNPETSTTAYIFAIVSLIIVLLSVIITCAETMPYLQNIPGYNMPYFWKTCEMGFNTWFLIELILRFLFSPNKCSFLTGTLNIFDILAVVPYFIVYAIDSSNVSSLGYLRILRLLRVIRLFRLSKHSERLQLVGAIIADSLQDLQLFVLCLLIIVIFGGSLMYQLENTNNSEMFSSIPQSMYWAVQTLVTVGYGDVVAVTSLGKFFSSFFMIFGALTISLPVMSVVMKFTSQYEVSN